MNTEVIILIITNVFVPIVVALIGLLATRRYKKDITLLKLTHKNEVEKLEMQYKHQLELIKQQAEMSMTGNLTDRLFEEALNNEDVKRKIHQGISRKKGDNPKWIN